MVVLENLRAKLNYRDRPVNIHHRFKTTHCETSCKDFLRFWKQQPISQHGDESFGAIAGLRRNLPLMRLQWWSSAICWRCVLFVSRKCRPWILTKYFWTQLFALLRSDARHWPEPERNVIDMYPVDWFGSEGDVKTHAVVKFHMRVNTEYFMSNWYFHFSVLHKAKNLKSLQNNALFALFGYCCFLNLAELLLAHL